LLSVVLLLSVSTFVFGVLDLVVTLPSDASRLPELEVVFLPEPPVSVATSVAPLLFLPDDVCATLDEPPPPRATLVPDDLLCPY
jgi:hypothetical protein